MKLPILTILILLSGYLYATGCNRYKYKFSRIKGAEAPLFCSFFGLIIVMFSAIEMVVFEAIIIYMKSIWGAADISFKNAIKESYSLWNPNNWEAVYYAVFLLSIITLVNAKLLIYVSNRFWYRNESYELYLAILQLGDEMDKLFAESLASQSMVSITLKNRKVYIGNICRTPDPKRDTTHIDLAPVYSGYRTSEELKLVITENYEDAYINQQDRGFEPQNFIVTINTSEILTASMFNKNAYDYFNQPEKASEQEQIVEKG
jgi:hypothetical protein